jgi:hypothetical protein
VGLYLFHRLRIIFVASGALSMRFRNERGFCYAFSAPRSHVGIAPGAPATDINITEAAMSRWMVRISFFLGLLVVAPGALAQEFSADVVNEKGTQDVKKIYSTRDKVRFEVGARNQAMGPSALIVDEAQNKWMVLLAERHMYMDSVPAMMKTPLVYQFWHVEDVDDACPQWKKTAEQAGTYKNWGSCTKVGSDSVNGRSTVKYEGVSNQGEKTHYWVDTKLHCVIKTDGGSGGVELRNIQEGSQPSSLFEVPAGYTKFDMGAMTQRSR